MNKIKLALGIISGRIKHLDIEDYEALGFDTYKFGAFGKPDMTATKNNAEDIILKLLMKDDNGQNLSD